MRIDRIDQQIFKIIKRKRNTTTTAIAKKIFSPESDHELRLKDNFIRARLKNWVKAGVMYAKEDNGRTVYNLPKDRIFTGNANLVIRSRGEDAVLPLGKGILIKTDDGWLLFEG